MSEERREEKGCFNCERRHDDLGECRTCDASFKCWESEAKGRPCSDFEVMHSGHAPEGVEVSTEKRCHNCAHADARMIGSPLLHLRA